MCFIYKTLYFVVHDLFLFYMLFFLYPKLVENKELCSNIYFFVEMNPQQQQLEINK